MASKGVDKTHSYSNQTQDTIQPLALAFQNCVTELQNQTLAINNTLHKKIGQMVIHKNPLNMIYTKGVIGPVWPTNCAFDLV
jgi:hypothetical protein